ncbi:WD40 repeat domain-containing protein [Methanochimaera problematica]|nr:hypothetical protein [Methanoplanus sp. FWC-SCC4]
MEANLIFEKNPGELIRDTAISESGDFITAITSDTVYVYDSSGNLITEKKSGNLKSLDISLDGEKILLASFGLTLIDQNADILWNDKSKYMALSAGLSGDQKYAYAGMDDEKIYSYSIESDKTLSAETDEDMMSLEISGDGNYIAGGTKEGNILLFDSGLNRKWKYKATFKPVTGISVTNNGNMIAACSSDNTVYLLSRAGRLLWSKNVDSPKDIAISSAGEKITVAVNPGLLFLDNKGEIKGHIELNKPATSIAADKNSEIIAVSAENKLYCYSLTDSDTKSDIDTNNENDKNADDITKTDSKSSESGHTNNTNLKNQSAPAGLFSLFGALFLIMIFRK